MPPRTRRLPTAAFQIVDPGSRLTFQDAGRIGWQQFGVPRGGAMDTLGMNMANLLVGNPPGQTVLEAALAGLRLRALRDTLIAVAGSDGVFSVGDQRLSGWRTILCREGEIFHVRRLTHGVWTYVAVPSGFDVPAVLGGAGNLPELQPSQPLKRRHVLHTCEPAADLPTDVASRSITPSAKRQTRPVVQLRMWPGPQRKRVGARAIATLLATTWTVSPKRDRVGYRLNGPVIPVAAAGTGIEPIPVGAVQIDPEGRPVVAMPDAPTLGVSPTVGVLDPHDVGRLAQCRSGQKVLFMWVKRTR